MTAIALLLLLGANSGTAVPQEKLLRLNPEEINALEDQGPGAGTSGVRGIRSVILSGDPARDGPYTIEVVVPPHTRIAAHSHRDDRSAVVVSGTWYLGYGVRPEEAEFKQLTAGSFYTEPAGTPHFAMTKDQGAVVYISGFGPSSTDDVRVDAVAEP
ncbi:cupin domain-containing protein [Sphingopyxis sp.]|uniref:cupin domain-containing protein n=1 Tax=Sphingopyxis sp. TaxID=1908224 RepID=UPI00260B868E|nr:cupin domain-containing protein [Sphingopyxis sp.]MCW0199852.1 cupin domain-containing protein [Sphingopyxis sp.]